MENLKPKVGGEIRATNDKIENFQIVVAFLLLTHICDKRKTVQ